MAILNRTSILVSGVEFKLDAVAGRKLRGLWHLHPPSDGTAAAFPIIRKKAPRAHAPPIPTGPTQYCRPVTPQFILLTPDWAVWVGGVVWAKFSMAKDCPEKGSRILPQGENLAPPPGWGVQQAQPFSSQPLLSPQTPSLFPSTIVLCFAAARKAAGRQRIFRCSFFGVQRWAENGLQWVRKGLARVNLGVKKKRFLHHQFF